MKKFSALALSAMLLLSSSALPSLEAEASTAKKFSSCKELNKTYANGVKKSKDVKNKVVNRKTKKASYQASKAVVDADVYKSNTKLDNDKDGIACEK